MKGNFHVQFLGEGVAATSPPYPTPGWATTQVYPARISRHRISPQPPATRRGGIRQVDGREVLHPVHARTWPHVAADIDLARKHPPEIGVTFLPLDLKRLARWKRS